MNSSLSEPVKLLNSAFSSFVETYLFGIVLFLLGLIVGRMLGRLTQRILNELTLDKTLKKLTGTKFSYERFFGLVVSYFIYFVALIIALDQMKISTTVLQVIAIAILAFLVVALLLGIKDFIPNVIAGIFMQERRYFNKGDIIRLKDTEGKIVYLSVVETRIKTKNGDIIYIPNSLLAKQEVVKLKKKRF